LRLDTTIAISPGWGFARLGGENVKSFYVETGYDALHRGVWYGPGVLLVLEEGESVEVYTAPRGRRGACIGNYAYERLNPAAPPKGLRSVGDR
jgi:hypothetical protein